MSKKKAVEQKPEKSPKEKFQESMYELVSVFVSAVVIIAILFSFICRFVGVVGPSMQDTLHEGDWLIVSSENYKPKYKDIVIISQPNIFDEVLVKRVIAVGGQTIDIDFKNGIVLVDGTVLDEPYIKGTTIDAEGTKLPLTVPEGYVFVMGDNRQQSTDSRSTYVGIIRDDYLLGKAYYSISGNGFTNLRK